MPPRRNYRGFAALFASILISAGAFAAGHAPAEAFSCPVAVAKGPVKPGPIVEEDTPFPGSKLYYPKDNQKHLAIVLLHGSEGGSAGTNTERAKQLAGLGYAALTLCYFDCAQKPGSPVATLKNVETTKVLDAVSWFRKKPFSNQKVVVYGFSRGAELTLITGAQNAGRRMPDALIAHTPSDVFNESFNLAWESPACWVCTKNKCDDNSPPADFTWNTRCGPDDPRKIDDAKSAWLQNGKPIPSGKRIPIEKFRGPILITVGERDEVWPVSQTRRVEAALKKAGKHPEVVYFPTGKHVFTEPANEECREALVLNFLKKIDRPHTPAPADLTFHSRVLPEQDPEGDKPAETPGTGSAF